MATPSVQTTLLSRETVSRGSGEKVRAIRWGFPDARGMLSLLSGQRVLFGRGDDCDVNLPGKEISRHHAELRRDASLHMSSFPGGTTMLANYDACSLTTCGNSCD